MAILSYDTLYYLEPDIFDGLQVPTQLTKADVVNNILLESMELETLYPDPHVIKQAVEIWSKARIRSWQRIADALYKDYDPFINFTRDEERTTEYTRGLDTAVTGSARGYNDNTMVDREKAVTNETGGATTHEYFHSQGDSALYTPTDVAEKETLLRIKFDIINIITREFLNRFCIMLY